MRDVKFFAALFLLSSTLDAQVEVTVIPLNSHQPTMVTGELNAWSASQITLTGTRSAKRLPFKTVRRIRFPDNTTVNVPQASATFVRLTNDDWIKVRSLSIKNDVAELSLSDPNGDSTPLNRSLSIRLDFLDSVQFGTQPRTTQLKHDNDDIVRLINGDILRGQLTTLEGNKLSLETVLGKIELDQQRVESIQMNPELAATPSPITEHCLLYCLDRSVITGSDLQLTGPQTLSAKILSGERVQWNLSELKRVDCYNARFVSLMDVPLRHANCSSYFGTPFLPVKNRNMKGESLKYDNEDFHRGWGVTSQSALEFELPAGYHGFLTQVGLDDSVAGQGKVDALIQLDSSTMFHQELNMKGLSTVPPIDISNSKMLTLSIEFGPAADIQDLTNWCDPVLIRN